MPGVATGAVAGIVADGGAGREATSIGAAEELGE
jgi:hypothetical protein